MSEYETVEYSTWLTWDTNLMYLGRGSLLGNRTQNNTYEYNSWTLRKDESSLVIFNSSSTANLTTFGAFCRIGEQSAFGTMEIWQEMFGSTSKQRAVANATVIRPLDRITIAMVHKMRSISTPESYQMFYELHLHSASRKLQQLTFDHRLSRDFQDHELKRMQLSNILHIGKHPVAISEIDYESNANLHAKLIITPTPIFATELTNLTFVTDLIQSLDGHNKRSKTLSVLTQLQPWLPAYTGMLRTTSNQAHKCETEVTSFLGELFPMQPGWNQSATVQGLFKQFPCNGYLSSPYYYVISLTVQQGDYTLLFEHFTGMGSVTLRSELSVVGALKTTSIYLSHESTDITQYSILNVRTGNVALWNSIFNWTHSLTEQNITIKYFIEQTNLHPHGYGLSFTVAQTPGGDRIQFGRIQSLDSETVVPNFMIASNMLKLHRADNSRSNVYLKFAVSGIRVSAIADPVERMVSLRIQLENEEEVNCILAVDNSIGEPESPTYQQVGLRIQVNSTYQFVPSSIWILQWTLHPTTIERRNNVSGFRVHAEAEISGYLSKQFADLTLLVNKTTEKSVLLNVTNSYLFPGRAIVKLIQLNHLYTWEYLLERTDLPRWNMFSNCSFDDEFNVDCSLGHIILGRIEKLYLLTNPTSGNYSFKLAWDDLNHGSVLIAMNLYEDVQKASLYTPLRTFWLTRKSKCLQTVEERNELWEFRMFENSENMVSKSPDGIYFAWKQYKLRQLERKSVRSWSATYEIISNLLMQNNLGIAINSTNEKDTYIFAVVPIVGSTQLIYWPILQIRIHQSFENQVHSDIQCQLGHVKLHLNGSHYLRGESVVSNLTIGLAEKHVQWNLLLDSWEKFHLLMTQNDQTVEVLQQLQRQNSEWMWIQRARYGHDRQMKFNHITRISLRPLWLNTNITSTQGSCYVTARHLYGDTFSLNVGHASSLGEKHQDVVWRIYMDSRNVLNSVLHWRPEFFKDTMLYVINQFTSNKVDLLLDEKWGAVVNKTVESTLTICDSVTAQFDADQIRTLGYALLNDIQVLPDLMKRWHDEDVFMIRTLNFSIISELASFDIPRLAENMSYALENYTHILPRVIEQYIAIPKLVATRVQVIRTAILQGQFPNFHHTFKTWTILANNTARWIHDLNKRIFNQVSAWIRAAHSFQTLCNTWLMDLQQHFISITVTPFVHALRDFGAYLTERLLWFRLPEFYAEEAFENFKNFVQQCFYVINSFFFAWKSDANPWQMINLIVNSSTMKNATRLFFRPELSYFQVDTERLRFHFATYISPMISEMWKQGITSYSYPQQVFTWIYPKRGMKSLMYAYDQYQRNFDSIQKLLHLVPPYDVGGWIMISRHDYAYLITLNGLFVPLPKWTNIRYMLLRDVITQFFRISMEFDRSTWVMMLETENVNLTVNNIGQISVFNAYDDGRIVLPHTYSDEFMRLTVRRIANRIAIEAKHGAYGIDLLSIHVDIGLQQIQIVLSGQWHGRCAGLLGSTSFDQIEEYNNPNHTIIVDQWVLADIWSYQREFAEMDITSMSPYASSIKNRSSAALKNQCTFHFANLASCLPAINPKPWMEACQMYPNITEVVSETALELSKSYLSLIDAHVCRVISTYVQQCKQHDVPLRVPSNCVVCAGDLKADGLSTISPIASPAKHRNLIFVIQLHQCMIQRKWELSKLVQMLEHKWPNQTSYSAVVVSATEVFGPTSWLTSSFGATEMNGEQFLNAFETLLQLSSVHDTVGTNETKDIDVLEAVLSVTRRPGSVMPTHELLLLYTCGTCATTSASMYAKVQRMLKRKGIDFHYLPDTAFQTSMGASDTAFLLRADDQVFELQEPAIAARANMRSIRSAHDQCSIIAKVTGGNIWAIHHVAVTDVRKLVLTRFFADTLMQPRAVEKQCLCRDNLHGQGVLDCVAKSTEPTTT